MELVPGQIRLITQPCRLQSSGVDLVGETRQGLGAGAGHGRGRIRLRIRVGRADPGRTVGHPKVSDRYPLSKPRQVLINPDYTH